MTTELAASNTSPASRRKLPVWAIAGIVGVMGAIGGGALSTALVKNARADADTPAQAPTVAPREPEAHGPPGHQDRPQAGGVAPGRAGSGRGVPRLRRGGEGRGGQGER